MPVKTKLAKGISLTCIAVSDFVDLLGLELKEYQKEDHWMEIEGSNGSLIGMGKMLQKGALRFKS